MASSPGIPIPSAMPKVSPERPSNGADDGGDEVVGVDKVVVEPKVGADVMILKGGDAVEYAGEKHLNRLRNFENLHIC